MKRLLLAVGILLVNLAGAQELPFLSRSSFEQYGGELVRVNSYDQKWKDESGGREFVVSSFLNKDKDKLTWEILSHFGFNMGNLNVLYQSPFDLGDETRVYILSKGRHLIGYALVNTKPDGRRAFLKYINIDEHFKGKGYSTNFLKSVIDDQLRNLKVREVGLDDGTSSGVGTVLYGKKMDEYFNVTRHETFYQYGLKTCSSSK